MKRVTKIIAALLLMTAVVWAVGFTKNNESPNTNENNGSYNGHEYVDLGLPSGTLWAACNVGANKPEEYGNYYAWGEIETKDTYNWSTYKWCNNEERSITKYCKDSFYGDNDFTDDLTHLQLSDDAARANWGEDWRMPTDAEWEELINNTTHMWTTRNGVNGRLFTASNGASLFLPAAGYRSDSSLRYDVTEGEYWSSSLYTSSPSNALLLYFSSGRCLMNYCERRCGAPIRAVLSASKN